MARLGSVASVSVSPAGATLIVDLGGGQQVTCDLYQSPGEDSPPLPGDLCVVDSAPGTGNYLATAVISELPTLLKSATGECRYFARSATGIATCELRLRNDGSVSIDSLVAQSVTINGVEITAGGDIVTSGSVRAASVVAADSVDLLSHTHTSSSPGLPSTPPIPTPIP